MLLHLERSRSFFLVLRFLPNLFIDVPCGKCTECQKSKFRDYRIRLLYEVNKYPNSIFVTLTFDNTNLSLFCDNPNKSIRLFLDRVRKKYGKQVRHWFVAEFGSKRGRLHYHGILFDIDIGNDELFKLWKYGNTFVGYANEATAKYIVKYLTKQDTKGIAPPRIISSFDIGSAWLDSSDCNLAKSAFSKIFYIDGFPTPIPRYYLSKMYSRDELDKITYYSYMEELPRNEFYLDGNIYFDEHKYNDARHYKFNNLHPDLHFNDYIKRSSIPQLTRFAINCESFNKFNSLF